MTANYVLLETITVGAAGAASVTFNNIPQTGYTDLVVKASARSNNAGTADAVLISFNASTASFSEKYLYGSGSAASSGSTPARYIGEAVGNSATANTFSNIDIYIPNYLSANYKSFSVDSVTENNATAAGADLIAGLWSATTAINQLLARFLKDHNPAQ